MAEKSSGVRELSVIGIGTSTPSIKSSSNLNLSASTVAVGATLSVGDGLQLVGVNTSLAGTSGTTGDIKMFHGAPFMHDGTAWREFFLKEGVPVTESADTEWDNVVLLTPFNKESNYFDSKFSINAFSAVNTDVVAAPRKFGTGSLRIPQNGYLTYNHRSEYDFEGDWTIEGWFYFDSIPVNIATYADVLISKSDGGAADTWAILAEDSPNAGYTDFKWFNYEKHGSSYGGIGIGSVTESSIFQSWNHIAVTRESTDGSIHFWFNGVESGITTNSSVIDNNIQNDSSASIYLGSNPIHGDGQDDWDGLIDNLRISTVARYISTEGSFTPPTEAYPTSGTLSGPVDPPYFGSVLEEVIADTEISSLSNVSSTTPSSGQVLKWNGSLWAPASDLTADGGSGISLTDLSVTSNPAGTNALSYNNSSGTFAFTPTSLVGYATEGYVDNAVLGIVTTGQISGFITAGASGAEFTALTGAAAGTYGNFDRSARITVDNNGRITGITEVGITTDGAGIDVTGISTFNDNVSFASTILVDGAVNLTVNNATIAGTAGSTGDIKMIGGAPFFYDGSSWREFSLASGTTVTDAEDTEWDNVILRSTFDTDYSDVSKSSNNIDAIANASLVTSPVKYGAKALRLQAGYASYPHVSNYNFTGEWTIEGWFYFDAIPINDISNADVLISKTDGGAANSWAILAEDSGNTGYTDFKWWNHEKHGSSYGGVGIGSVTESSIFQSWNHIAVVREPDNGSIHFYFNGVESEKTINDQVIDNNIQTDSSAKIYLGKNPTLSGQDDWDGVIDDLRISTVARYTSIGSATTTTFTPPTEAYPTSGTLTTTVNPPGDKYGEIGLGTSPTWTGTSGVTVSQQGQGEYRLTFTSSYTDVDDYFVLTQPMDQGFSAYVGAARSTTHVDFTINKQSDNVGVNTGSLAVQVTNHS